MRHILEMNSRTSISMSAESKHTHFISCLKDIGPPWGLDKDVDIPFPGFKDELTAIVHLDKLLQNGIKATIFYRYRNMLDDDSSHDDRFYVEFSTKKIDYNYLTNEIVKQYIDCFTPYSLFVYNEKVIYEDFERTRSKNFRNYIARFTPVFYIDRDLSYRALRLSIPELKQKLISHAEKVRVIHDGVLVIFKSSPLDLESSNEVNKYISKLLMKEGDKV
ncbi:MAG: hypothetical protein ACTHMD_16895 [Flavisolibacter sp.]